MWFCSDWSAGVLIQVITGYICSSRSASPLVLMSTPDSQLLLLGFALFPEQLVMKLVQSDRATLPWLYTHKQHHSHTKYMKLYFFYLFLSFSVTHRKLSSDFGHDLTAAHCRCDKVSHGVKNMKVKENGAAKEKKKMALFSRVFFKAAMKGTFKSCSK